ncbi:MAG: FeoA family protein [Bacteroidota bacterium]
MSGLRLNTLRPGDTCAVEKIVSADPKLRMRLLEMGIIKGTQVEVIRYAPLGDPIELKVRGYRLSIRIEEAASVIVVKLS